MHPHAVLGNGSLGLGDLGSLRRRRRAHHEHEHLRKGLPSLHGSPLGHIMYDALSLKQGKEKSPAPLC
jgi:hypothetical protein